jgi:hypothetical protein
MRALFGDLTIGGVGTSDLSRQWPAWALRNLVCPNWNGPPQDGRPIIFFLFSRPLTPQNRNSAHRKARDISILKFFKNGRA